MVSIFQEKIALIPRQPASRYGLPFLHLHLHPHPHLHPHALSSLSSSRCSDVSLSRLYRCSRRSRLAAAPLLLSLPTFAAPLSPPPSSSHSLFIEIPFAQAAAARCCSFALLTEIPFTQEPRSHFRFRFLLIDIPLAQVATACYCPSAFSTEIPLTQTACRLFLSFPFYRNPPHSGKGPLAIARSLSTRPVRLISPQPLSQLSRSSGQGGLPGALFRSAPGT